MSLLSSLSSNLQHLTLKVEPSVSCTASDLGFLSSLRLLTALELSIGIRRTGLAAISGCTALQDLRLIAVRAHDMGWTEDDNRLSVQENAALAQLVQLTRLRMEEVRWTKDAASSSCGAVQQLTNLRVLHVEEMDSSCLPVLAGLRGLSSLSGSWVADMQHQRCAAAAGPLPLLMSLTVATIRGCLPLKYFPKLQHNEVDDTCIHPSWLVSLSHHCKLLQSLVLVGQYPPPICSQSLDWKFAQADRCAALRSLVTLAHLTRLAFAAQDNGEVASIAALTQLKTLQLHLPLSFHTESVSAPGLAMLHKLTRLSSLSLAFSVQLVTVGEARCLLIVLSFLRKLRVVLHTSQPQHSSFYIANEEYDYWACPRLDVWTSSQHMTNLLLLLCDDELLLDASNINYAVSVPS